MILSDTYISSISSDTRRNIGELVYSLLPITDPGMYLCDGSIFYRRGIYNTFVDYVFAVCKRGNFPNIFVTEEEWQESVSKYGVCGKWVVNDENETVRIPKVTGFVEGTIDPTALGQLKEAGLPNIEGHLQIAHNSPYIQGQSGALYGGVTRIKMYGANSGSGGKDIHLDASLSNPIYGNSDTVQPQSVTGFIYIVVSPVMSLAPTDIKDEFKNVISAVEQKTPLWAAHAAMPSGKFETLKLPSSEELVTVPADGYISYSATPVTSSAMAYVFVQNSTKGYSTQSVGGFGSNINGLFPVSANDMIKVLYHNANISKFGFVYCNGTVSN